MIKYGLINKVDVSVIEKTLLMAVNESSNDTINTLEIGIFDGQTSRGIHEFILSHGRKNVHTAIDSHKDFPTKKPFEDCVFIEGNSIEVYYLVKDFSQDFIFVDGCHAYPIVVADFFCYKDKVKLGGYMAFHDVGKHIRLFKDYQRMGSKDDPDMFISVRRALNEIGLLTNQYNGWELVFSQADEKDEAGGTCVFKRLL